MNWRERIERKPAVLGGEPVVRGTRVPVRVLVAGLAGGMTMEQVCASYRVDVEDVRAALHHAVEGMSDVATLERWLTRAVTAASAATVIEPAP